MSANTFERSTHPVVDVVVFTFVRLEDGAVRLSRLGLENRVLKVSPPEVNDSASTPYSIPFSKSVTTLGARFEACSHASGFPNHTTCW